MKAFLAMVAASVTMLRRNRILLVTSLGLAVVSILIFGWLFGGTGTSTLSLGVVDEDHSAITQQMVTSLQHNKSLVVSHGSASSEVQELRNGNRGAVIVMPAGFGANFTHGAATLQVYYDQSNPVEQAIAQAAVQSIVASLNQQSGVGARVALQEQAVSAHNLRQVDWRTPGMLGMLLMWVNLPVGVTLVTWRKEGIMRRLAATPLRPSALIGSQVLARLILSLGQGVILLAIAILVFKVQIMGSWFALLATTTLGSLALLAIGFVIGSFARTQEVAQAISTLISFPMMFLSGSYFPVSSAPGFLTPVIKAMPLSYLNDALRQIINNGASLASVQTDLLVLTAWLVAALLLSIRAFRWA